MSITKIYRRTMVIVAAICIALAFMSFNTTFCDFYTDNIYPYIADTLGWITSGVEVAVGEIVMYLAIISLIVLLVMVVLLTSPSPVIHTNTPLQCAYIFPFSSGILSIQP